MKRANLKMKQPNLFIFKRLKPNIYLNIVTSAQK